MYRYRRWLCVAVAWNRREYSRAHKLHYLCTSITTEKFICSVNLLKFAKCVGMHVCFSLLSFIFYSTPSATQESSCISNRNPHSIDDPLYATMVQSWYQQAIRLRHMVDACVLEISSWESISHQIKTINNCAAREIFIFNANGYNGLFFLGEQPRSVHKNWHFILDADTVLYDCIYYGDTATQ